MKRCGDGVERFTDFVQRLEAYLPFTATRKRNVSMTLRHQVS